jgi:hypothetical protein
MTLRYMHLAPSALREAIGLLDDLGSRWAVRSRPPFEVARTLKDYQRTRLQPIRTVSEIELDLVVFTQGLFPFQAIAAEAQAMRRL